MTKSKSGPDSKPEKKLDFNKIPDKKSEKTAELKLEKKTEKKVEKNIGVAEKVKLSVDPGIKPNHIGSKSMFRLNVFLIILILIILGAVIGYSVTQLKNLQANVNNIAAQYDQSQKNYIAAEAQIDNLKENLSNQDATLQSLQQSLNKFASAKKHQEWQVQEIKYLVNLANYAVTFSQDPNTAYELLNTADQAILELNDSRMVVLRQAIGKDMEQLKSVRKIDIAGLFIKLDTLSEVISKAPLIGESGVLRSIDSAQDASANDDAKEIGRAEATETSHWKIKLKQSWDQLKSLITVRDQSDGLKPLVARQGGDYIFQYVALEIGQAQWGLLHRDNMVYQTSLKQAEHWLNRYFVSTDSETQKALNLFAELEAENINLDKVNLQSTLNAMVAFEQQA